jgi:organic hydroperoxide reductase OsmC/OhrA
MHPFPHRYSVSARTTPDGDPRVTSAGLPELQTAAPIEFDGPGGRWSPEGLLVAAVADCFALTFRGIARVSRLPYLSFTCDVTGTLDRPGRVAAEFTEFHVYARVELPHDANPDQARRIIMKAEETCLVTRSLKGAVHLTIEVDVEAPVAA